MTYADLISATRALSEKANLGPLHADEENCGGGLNIRDARGVRIAHTAEQRDRRGAIVVTEQARAHARLLAHAASAFPALAQGLEDALDVIEAARALRGFTSHRPTLTEEQRQGYADAHRDAQVEFDMALAHFDAREAEETQ